MSNSDWLALAGVVFSCLALSVSLLALRLQARTQKSDDEKELADQIAAIQAQMAQLGHAASPDRPMEGIANTSNVNAALQGLVLRVAALIKGSELQPDWFQTLVLATTFLQVGDVSGAHDYVQRAVDLAEGDSASLMVSLRMRAAFYFSRATDGDAERGRDDFRAARHAVAERSAEQGPYVTAGQVVELHVREADFELGLGDVERAAASVGAACAEWQGIGPPGPRQACGLLLATFIVSQGIVAPAALRLPADAIAELDQLLRRAGAAVAVGAAQAPRHELNAHRPGLDIWETAVKITVISHRQRGSP